MILFARRAINLAALVLSYLYSRLLRKPSHRGFPVSVSIEPTNLCNLSCPECPSGMKELTRPRGHIDPALFRRVIDELSPELRYLTLYFQGEPYLDSNFNDLVRYARSRKIVVTTSTNGHFLTPAHVKETLDSGLDRLIISLDGPDPVSYAAYRRGGDFHRVTEGIRLLVTEKKRQGLKHPEIILQCLLLRTNETRLDDVRRLGRSLGVDRVEFKTAQFYDFEHGNPLMPENPGFSRYRKQVRSPQSAVRSLFDESAHQHTSTSAHQHTSTSAHQHISISAHQHISYVIKNPLRNACFRMWTSCVITWDGKVVPCCYDKDAEHVLGDLEESSFREIWRGEKAVRFRRRILKGRKSIEMCTNCDQRF